MLGVTSNRRWGYAAVLVVLGTFCWNNVTMTNVVLSDYSVASMNSQQQQPYDEDGSISSLPFSFHFPSKEERLKYYMGDWYNVTNMQEFWNASSTFCKEIRYFNATKWPKKTSDKAFLFDSRNLQTYPFPHYTRDIQKYLLSSSTNNNNPLFAISAGDQHPSLHHPVIMKSRELPGFRALPPNAKTPILSLLNEKRHYGQVTRQQRRKRFFWYRPWHSKHDKLVWRGSQTGQGNSVKRAALIEQFQTHLDKDKTNNTTSTFTQIPIDIAFEPKLSASQLLQNKYLLSLEGNDVASGLKWMLYSPNVVVFKPPPTHVSWAMEDKLVPYYHYVPVLANLSDLPRQLQWAHEHPTQCRQISQHATEYMEQLYASRQAQKDNLWIHQQIAQIYQEQFGHVLNKCKRK